MCKYYQQFLTKYAFIIQKFYRYKLKKMALLLRGAYCRKEWGNWCPKNRNYSYIITRTDKKDVKHQTVDATTWMVLMYYSVVPLIGCR